MPCIATKSSAKRVHKCKIIAGVNRDRQESSFDFGPPKVYGVNAISNKYVSNFC